MPDLPEETEVSSPNSDWEREKFERECRLRQDQLDIERKRLRNEQIRSWMIGAFVPIFLAIIGTAPMYYESVQQEEQTRSTLTQQKAQFEASLIMQAVSTTEEGTLTNMNFLIDTGLIGDDVSERLSSYFEALETGADEP